MIIPPFIKKGDTIGIAATARKIRKEELGDAIALIEEKGYAVKLSTNLFAEDNQFAGTDEQRANDLQELINDPAVKAIIIARGGYGSMRIADRIDLKPLQKNPKWLIGYSDITVWHSALNCHHIASLHATMPINFTKNIEATNTLFNFL
ncbi:MAG: LD-carboxypeptidase, partial [Bacteroidota bacterium]